MFLSPTEGMGDWTPKAEVAERLGIAPGSAVPSDPATFGELQKGFEAWLKSAGGRNGNAVLFYYSGHGLWKAGTILTTEDTRLPGPGQAEANLIDIRNTLVFMFNASPAVQCFFADACQEITGEIL